MGLDMFLTARRSVYSFEEGDKESKLAEAVRERLPETADMKLWSLSFEAVYWRKANAVHYWFVKNVQEGKDDCGEYYVRKEDLKQLLADCELVLDDHSLAAEFMPSVSGFFFGSTDYDEYYFADLKFTRDKLKKLLSEPEMDRYSFYYSSSW